MKAIALEVVEQFGHILAFVDAADVEQERLFEAKLLPKTGRRRIAGRLNPHAGDRIGHVGIARDPLHQQPLRLGQIEDAAWQVEQRPEEGHADERVIMGRGHEKRLIGDEGQAEVGRGVVEGVEDEGVGRLVGAANGCEKGRGERPLLLDPGHFVEQRVLVGCHQARLPLRVLPVARRVDREAAHAHAVDLVLARRVVVGPGDVIEGAGRQDGHIGRGGQPLGQPAGVLLRPAVDFEAVALDDDGDPARGHRPFRPNACPRKCSTLRSSAASS